MPGWLRREPDVCLSSFSPDRNEYAWPRISGVARRRGGGGFGGSARRAWRVVPSGESGRSPGRREEPRAGAADRDRLDRSRRAHVARGEAQPDGGTARERRAEEVAQRAVRRVNPCAGARRVGFDVRGGVGAGAVEARVGPGGSTRQRELHEGREQPEGVDPATGAGETPHVAISRDPTASRFPIPATISSSAYMQTIRGPVGKLPTYD